MRSSPVAAGKFTSSAPTAAPFGLLIPNGAATSLRFASLRRKVVRALLVIGAVGVAIVLRLLPAE